jgi:hypothetical protein
LSLKLLSSRLKLFGVTEFPCHVHKFIVLTSFVLHFHYQFVKSIISLDKLGCIAVTFVLSNLVVDVAEC